MLPGDLYELRWAGDPRISPDGRTAAFVVWSTDRETNDYTASIWLVAVDGAAEPRRLTRGKNQDARRARGQEQGRRPGRSPRGEPARLRLEPRLEGEAPLRAPHGGRRAAPADRAR